MKITILDSILHGELKPWKLPPGLTQQLVNRLTNATGRTPITYRELYEQLSELLEDFPTLKEYLKAEKIEDDYKLIEHFYATNLPLYRNAFTQFYYLLYRQETLRLFNVLIVKNSSRTRDDIDFHVGQTLKSIRILTQQLTDEMRERNFSGIPDAENDPVLYTLFVARHLLIILFFEAQEYFQQFLSNPIKPKFYFQNYLHEPFEDSLLSPDIMHYENKLILMLACDNFIRVEALNGLHQLREKKLKNPLVVEAKYENAIYLHDEGIAVDCDLLDSLVNDDALKSYSEQKKVSILSDVNQYNYGFERLEVINNALSDLDYVSLETNNKYSIPSVLCKWLCGQKEIYITNASNIFASSSEAKGKKPVLSKQDKKTLEEQKSIATEHLKFMSGCDIKNEKIMSDNEYSRMLEYTYHLIEKGKLPTGIKKIQQTGFALNGIRYTFYKIHEALYGTNRIKEVWIQFLHAVFQQFSGTSESTTKTKFSEKPKSYDEDMQQMKR